MGTVNVKFTLALLGAISLVLFGALNVRADMPDYSDVGSLRCGVGMVQPGAVESEVLDQCGEPTSASSAPVYSRALDGVTAAYIDRWVYNRGPSDYIYTLVFRGGHLVEIRRGDRGF